LCDNLEPKSQILTAGVKNWRAKEKEQKFTSSYLLENILAVEAVEVLCPEVNLRPPHKI
jgi:hypothetical protein